VNTGVNGAGPASYAAYTPAKSGHVELNTEDMTPLERAQLAALQARQEAYAARGELLQRDTQAFVEALQARLALSPVKKFGG